MAPWDGIDSWGGHKVPGFVKSSLTHHLTMKFCIYPQDAFRTINFTLLFFWGGQGTRGQSGNLVASPIAYHSQNKYLGASPKIVGI